MVQEFVNRARHEDKLQDPVSLDDREKWIVLVFRLFRLDSGPRDIEFAQWSIAQPYLELRDLAYFITSRQIRGGVLEVLLFSQYLYSALENGGARVALFKERAVARFLMSNWERLPNITLDSTSFDTSFLDYLVATIQTEKVHLLHAAPIFARIPGEFDQKTFGDYIRLANPAEWVEPSRFTELRSVDRFYVIETLIAMPGDVAMLHRLSHAKDELEKSWAGRVFERIGMSKALVDQFSAAVGSTLAKP